MLLLVIIGFISGFLTISDDDDDDSDDDVRVLEW